jgi:hypothetical protein
MNTETIINNLNAALNAANKAGLFTLVESAALAETLQHVVNKLQQLDGKESNSNQPE